MRTLVALALLASISSCAHPVYAADECNRLSVSRSNNPAWPHVQIQGTDMTRFLANYNAQEPVTNHKPEQVWVAYIKGQPTVHLLLVDNGCVTFTDEIPTDEFFKMLTDVPHLPGSPA